MQESKEILPRLEDVPVDEYDLQRFIQEISMHGGRCAIDATREHFSKIYGRGVHYLCTVEFPEGTYRVLDEAGPVMTLFTIYFPDDGTMKGAIVKREYAKPGEAPTATILYARGTGRMAGPDGLY